MSIRNDINDFIERVQFGEKLFFSHSIYGQHFSKITIIIIIIVVKIILSKLLIFKHLDVQLNQVKDAQNSLLNDKNIYISRYF